MAITITTQPRQSSAAVGDTHAFTIAATAANPLTYQWYLNGSPVDGETGTSYSFSASTSNSFSRVACLVTDSSAGESIYSDIVVAISESVAASSNATRHALVYNYDDDNFTWKDPLVEIMADSGQWGLFDIDYQVYGFTPGWQARWDDWASGGVSESTWEDAKAGGTNATLWSDTFERGESKQVMQVTNGLLYKANDQINRKGSLKQYYVERTQMDLDDMVPEWTTNKIKQIKQFVFHMQSDQRFVLPGTANDFDFYVGWSNNLMEDPNWKAPVTVSLEDRKAGGKHKVDFRSSGRYLAMHYDLTNSQQLAFTGGDIDANEVGGR